MKRQIIYPAEIIATIIIALVAIPVLAAFGFMLRYLLLAAIPIVLVGYALAYAISQRVREIFSPETLDRFGINGFQVPQGLLFHPSHSWVRLESPKKVAIGVDDFMQRILGPLEEIEIPQIGRRIQRGEKVFQLRHGTRSVEVKSPVDGIVCSVNKRLFQNPTLVNEAPYSEGWVVKLRPANLAENIKNLWVANEAREWFRKELERLRTLLSPHPLLAQALPDGGMVVDDLSRQIDNATWLQIKAAFFNNLD